MTSYKEGDKVKVKNGEKWINGEILHLGCLDPESYMVELTDGSRGVFDLWHLAHDYKLKAKLKELGSYADKFMNDALK